jgi:hypothetical protein
MTLVPIKYLSEAYFQLLRAKPNWTELGRLGETFIIAINDKLAVEIGPEGVEQLPDNIKQALNIQ